MDDIGQTSSCTICLGDYENTEELRLLPRGHCFHAECVDAWLQQIEYAQFAKLMYMIYL